MSGATYAELLLQAMQGMLTFFFYSKNTLFIFSIISNAIFIITHFNNSKHVGLPNDISRHLNLIHKLDADVEALRKSIADSRRHILLACNKREDITQELVRDTSQQLIRLHHSEKQLWILSQEKIAVVEDAKRLLANFIVRTDNDLLRFNDTLKPYEINKIIDDERHDDNNFGNIIPEIYPSISRNPQRYLDVLKHQEDIEQNPPQFPNNTPSFNQNGNVYNINWPDVAQKHIPVEPITTSTNTNSSNDHSSHTNTVAAIAAASIITSSSVQPVANNINNNNTSNNTANKYIATQTSSVTQQQPAAQPPPTTIAAQPLPPKNQVKPTTVSMPQKIALPTPTHEGASNNINLPSTTSQKHSAGNQNYQQQQPLQTRQHANQQPVATMQQAQVQVQPSTAPVKIWCTCKRQLGEEMVGCDNENCPIDWFHLSCVGLKQLPDEGVEWFCSPACKDQHYKATGR